MACSASGEPSSGTRIDRKLPTLGVMVNLLSSQEREPLSSLLGDLAPAQPAKSQLHCPAPMGHRLLELLGENRELAGTMAEAQLVIQLPIQGGHEFRCQPQLRRVNRLDYLSQDLYRGPVHLESSG